MMGGLASLIIDLNRKGYTIIFNWDVAPDTTIIKIMKEHCGQTYVQYQHISKTYIEFINTDIENLICDVLMKMVDQLDKHIESNGFTRTTLYEKRGDSE